MMNLLKPFGTESFLIGVGLAAASYLLGPTIKQGARGVAVKGMQGALMAGDVANNTMEASRDKLGNFMHKFMDNRDNGKMEVEYSFQKELINELKADREQYNKVLNEMISTMKSIQEDVKTLKANNNDTDN